MESLNLTGKITDPIIKPVEPIIKPVEKPIDVEGIKKVLKSLEGLQDDWCKECIDDPEEMMQDLPGVFKGLVDQMRRCLNMPVFEYSAVYGVPGKEIDVTKYLEVYETSKSVKIKIYASNAYFKCDPAPHVVKRLALTYSYGDTKKTEEYAEGSQGTLVLNIPN